MSITQNEKISQVTDRTLVVGIDISSETHYVRAFDWRGLELEKIFKFESTSYGFECFSEWLSELCKTNQKDNIIIGAEPTGHYWFTLAEYLKENNITTDRKIYQRTAFCTKNRHQRQPQGLVCGRRIQAITQ